MELRTRNPFYTLVKFLFVLEIVIMHCDVRGFFPKAYVLTDFFFILHGYFLICKFEKHEAKKIDIGKYILNQYKKYLPIMICATLIHTIIVILGHYPIAAKELLVGDIIEISLLQAVIPQLVINQGALWFVSAMLFASIAAVVFLNIASSSARRIAPIIIALVLYVWIFFTEGCLDAWWQKTSLFFLFGIFRAIAGAFLGMWVGTLKDMAFDFGFVKAISVVAVILVSTLTFVEGSRMVLDVVSLGLFVMLIYFGKAYRPVKTWIFPFVEKVSLAMYVFQLSAFKILDLFISGRGRKYMIILLSLTVIMACVWVCIGNIFRNNGRYIGEE